MFLDIFKFELNYHRQQYVFYIMSGVVFLLFFMATTSPNVQIGGGGSNINLNASMAILNTLGAVTFVSIIVSIAFTANSVVRDYEYKTIELYLSRPMHKGSFVYGRYLGSLVFGFMVYFAGLLGVLLGEFMPWLDPERLGPFQLAPYIYGTLLLGIPNLVIFSSIFFCIAAVTRSMAYTYVAAVGLFMLNFLVSFFTDRELVQFTSFLDPFGGSAIAEVTRYWTPYESNQQLPPVEGSILINRVIWLVIALAFLAASYRLYPLAINQSVKKQRSGNTPEATIRKLPAATSISQHFGMGATLSQLLSQARIEVRSIVTSVPFIVVMILGMVQVIAGAAGNLGNIAGTPVFPTTGNMITVINGVFSLPLLVVLVYMSGEMMARERSTGISELMDAMPYPNWIMIGAKWLGLATVIILMLFAVMVGAITFQLVNGYTDVNVLQYLVGLMFFFQFPMYLMVTLSLFFYVLTRNKYIAMFLMILYVVLSLVLPAMGYQHNLYLMTQVGMPYSDFNGYDQNLVPHLWQTFYWGLFGCLLLLATHLLWPRGIEDSWANRVKLMRARMNRPVVVSLWAFSTMFLLTGAFIYYNTNVLNEYRSSKDIERLQAEYEKAYKQYTHLPMPEIVNVYAEVDIYPGKREVFVRGYYDMTNRHDQPISEIHFSDPPEVDVRVLELPPSELTFDETLGYRIYRLTEPLAPGESMRVNFESDWVTPGFANRGHTSRLVSNGTFFNNTEVFPAPGYQSRVELQDNNTRREHDLPPVERFRDLDDPAGKDSVGLFSGGRVNFETLVSTRVGQIAIAPGYLQEDWQDKGRHYYRYKMDAPIWNFFSYVSADYEVQRDKWKDVAIEVYYIHDYNVGTMIESTRDSLAYFTENFSPYQYRQFRIMEFPGFQGRFAQSFPNTIPFSESIGFTADLTDKSDLDYVYYVTAHELAHQWWAHQVLGADVQGSTLIVETLAQYSALMVMEQKFGEAQMQRFLSYELDAYLQGRGSEIIEELPLYRVENQPYVHYRKGSLVFYALKDLVGEAVINDALAAFIDQYAFKGAPYPTTRELLALIRERTDPQYASMITDMFEKIVLFDLKVDEAQVTEGDDGGFDVVMDVSAVKFEADGAGAETEVPLSDWIDVGVLGTEDEDTGVPAIIHLEKVYMGASQGTYRFRVDQKPVSVGIDPLNKLIDRNPDNNVKKL